MEVGFWTSLTLSLGIVSTLAAGTSMFLLLALVVEGIFASTVIVALDLLRGSLAVSSFVRSAGLPQIAQVGFGESLWATWMATSHVQRTPELATHLRLQYVDYAANGALLHSSIYLSEAVYRLIFAFLNSGCETETPEYLVPQDDDFWRTDGAEQDDLQPKSADAGDSGREPRRRTKRLR